VWLNWLATITWHVAVVVNLQAAESGGAAGGELVTDAEGHMHVEKVVQVSQQQQTYLGAMLVLAQPAAHCFFCSGKQ
jgi:hypothetical protein